MTEQDAITKRGAKRISLSPEYRAAQARIVIESTEILTDRIAGSEPIPGSKATRAGFAAYAKSLRKEISIAYGSGNLPDFCHSLPHIEHLRNSVIQRLVYPRGETSPKIPGVALMMMPTEDGWTGFFVGESYTRRVKVDQKEVKQADVEFAKSILSKWRVAK